MKKYYIIPCISAYFSIVRDRDYCNSCYRALQGELLPLQKSTYIRSSTLNVQLQESVFFARGRTCPVSRCRHRRRCSAACAFAASRVCAESIIVGIHAVRWTTRDPQLACCEVSVPKKNEASFRCPLLVCFNRHNDQLELFPLLYAYVFFLGL